MPLTNLEIFDSWARSNMLEKLEQKINVWNEQTRGAMVLKSGDNDGNFSDQSYWKRLTGLVIDRDPNLDAAVSPLTLAQLLDTSVKIGKATPPVNIPDSRMRWINEDPRAEGMRYAEQLAEDRVQDMVNASIGALTAALLTEGTNIYDGTAATATLRGFNQATRKFGDRASDIAVWVMHSVVENDVWDTALTNGENLFTFGNVRVIQDGHGRPFIVTDSADLVADNSGTDNYNTLGLVPGAVIVEDNDDFNQNIETSNGKTNINRTIQSEWSYNLALKGMPWDKTNGGSAPTGAEIRTGTNWDRVATSNKDLPGVIYTSL